MPYIGKPQSADPITVNTSNIDDGTIQAVDISSSFREHISGSFTTGFEHTGKISGSSTSTGSFGKVEVGGGKITTAGNMTLDADGAQIRFEDGGTEFGRISRVSSDLVIKSISNNNDILFKGVDGSATITALTLDMSEAGNATFNSGITATTGTITGDFSVGGTITAQEVHTEFESASIIFTSGSTIFGNSSDDIHNMTGSLNVSGAINLNDGNLIVTDNIGISTTSPSSPLHVVGSSSGGFLGGGIRINDTNHSSDWFIGGTSSGKLQIAESVSGNTRMVFDTSGRVGIGTTNPNELLHVEGTSPSIRIKASNEGGEPELKLQSDQGDDYADLFSIRAVNEHALNIINFAGDTATSMMFISGSGDVGIGTTNPDGKLHIHDGSAGSVTANGDAANLVIESSATGVDTGLSILSKNTRTNQIFFGDEDDNDIGAIGYVHNGNFMYFRTNTSERMRITSAGDVGIGTNSPDAGLDLRDTMKLQTNTVPASLIVGTNDTTDHTGQDSALCIDFRNLSTTNGVASGIVGLDKDGLELSKVLLVTDNHDSNTSSIRFYTSTNADQRSEKLAIQSDGGIIQTRGKYARFSGNWEILDVVSRNSDSNDIQSSNCFADNRYGYFKIVIPYIKGTQDGADLQLTFLYNAGSGLTEDGAGYYGHKQTMGHGTSGYGGAVIDNSSQMTLFTNHWADNAGGIQGELYIYNTVYHDTSNFDTSIFSNHAYTGNGDRGNVYRPIGRGELLGYNTGGTYGYARDSSFFRLNTDRDPDHWKGFRLKFSSGNVAAQSRFIVCGMPL